MEVNSSQATDKQRCKDSERRRVETERTAWDRSLGKSSFPGERGGGASKQEASRSVQMGFACAVLNASRTLEKGFSKRAHAADQEDKEDEGQQGTQDTDTKKVTGGLGHKLSWGV